MFSEEKARGVCLTLIKISVYAKRAELRHRLERLAFDLIEHAATRDFQGFLRTASVLDGLIKFGKNVYEIEPVNADMVIQELGKLNEAMRQIADLSLPDLEKPPSQISDLSNNATLFEAMKTNAAIVIARDNPAMGQEIQQSVAGDTAIKTGNVGLEPGKARKKKPANPTILKDADDKTGNPPLGTVENAAIRQTAIVERIRQSGNDPVKFKDVIAAFPDVSERTIRYDLQRLSNQGIIERVGESGYYKIRII